MLVPIPEKKTLVAGQPSKENSGTSEKKEVTTQSSDKPAVGESKPSQPETPPYLIFVLLGGVVLMWIWMGRGRRKEQAKRKEMLSNLKKGDKIVTIGGIIGTVIEVKPDEVTVKVDETNNVRMKFTRNAIHGVGNEARTTLDEEKK